MKKVVVPNTPQTFANTVVTLIDSATPNKVSALSEQGVYQSKHRLANNIVLEASSSVVKSDLKVKRKLIAECKTGTTSKKSFNKTLVAEKAGFSRQSLLRPLNTLNTKGMSLEMKNLVRDFYLQMDISTSLPNKRRTGSGPLYILKDTMKKTFAKFQEENNVKISCTTFWKLKPKNVKKCGSAKLFQCVCDLCENISLAAQSMRYSMLKDGIEIPDVFNNQHGTDVMTRRIAFSTLCSKHVHNPSCLDRKCQNCGTGDMSTVLLSWATNNDEDIRWCKWELKEQVVKGKVVKRLTKVVKHSSRLVLVNDFLDQLTPFGRHVYTEYAQTSAYHQCLKSTTSTELVVVIDFAENYSCLRQGEAQSAYYSRNQVTLHPMVITINESDEVLRDSVVIVSDDLTHDSSAVLQFFKVFLAHVGIHYPAIQTIHIWSDGCAAQYKSK